MLLDSDEEHLANDIDPGFQDIEEEDEAESGDEEPEECFDSGEMIEDDPSIGEDTNEMFFEDNGVRV